MIETKKTVTLDSNLKITVDMNRAGSPQARLALMRQDEGDPYGLLRFLKLAIGDEQLDRLIASLEKDGEPGDDAALFAAVREMFDKLGQSGKKS